jgi:hypothetical protein
VLGALDRLKGACGGVQGVRMATTPPAARNLPWRNIGEAEARGSIVWLGELPGPEAKLLQGSAGSGVRWSDGSTVTQRSQRGEPTGSRAGASVAAVAAKVGQKGLEILFVGRRGTLGVRAECESLAGDLGWPVRVGEKEGGERRGEMLTCGPWLAERERERSGWGGAGPRAHAGPREEEGEEAQLGLADGGGLAADVRWGSADGSRARPM